MMRKTIPYKPHLIALAKKLRNNMSYGEIALWRELKGKKLGARFSRQLPMDHYIVDFYCKDLQLAIEVDGSIHFGEGQQEKDAIRQERLTSLGITMIRFSDSDAKNNLSFVLDELKAYIQNVKPTTSPSQEGNFF